MPERDGHVHVLPTEVANQIAAGEVVERPASVVKELVENALDAGATKIAVTIEKGGTRLIQVSDDGCGMERQDAVLAFERQATSKILAAADIASVETLGFRGEAIPSIASVSRFRLTTRRAGTDEGTLIRVDAGQQHAPEAAGCPVGTRVEVRDLFCNLPARRKFLRSLVTEEGHVRQVVVSHALAHPAVAFSLAADGREVLKLVPAADLAERVRELLGAELSERLLPLAGTVGAVKVNGFIERPDANALSRRDQYVFVNGRPASAPAVGYALREGYPRRQGNDSRPAAVVFITLPAEQVDVNVHPAKREVRFRDQFAVKAAIGAALDHALGQALPGYATPPPATQAATAFVAPAPTPQQAAAATPALPAETAPAFTPPAPAAATPVANPPPSAGAESALPAPRPVQVEFAIDPDSPATAPWAWFKVLAVTESGYLLLETDAGLVTVNPHAARERIAYERLLDHAHQSVLSQSLLLPESVQLSSVESARLKNVIPILTAMGFRLAEMGHDFWMVEAVPQLVEKLAVGDVLVTIARDLAEGVSRRAGERWREELIARSVARSFAGQPLALDEKSATALVEELAGCRSPYVCPRMKPIMIFTSNRELSRKFARE